MAMSLSRIAAQIREKSRRNVEYKAKLETYDRKNEGIGNYIKSIEEKSEKAKRRLVIQKINFFSVCSLNEVIKTIHVESPKERVKEAEIKKEKTEKKVKLLLEELDETTALVAKNHDDTSHPIRTQQNEQFEAKKMALMEESESLTEDIEQLRIKLENAEKFYDVRLNYHETLELEQKQARVSKPNQVKALSTAQKKFQQLSEQVDHAGDNDEATNRIKGTDFVLASTMLVHKKPH